MLQAEHLCYCIHREVRSLDSRWLVTLSSTSAHKIRSLK
ncbi:hypothetical protein VP150E351_P0159 [Vibrio phage 150E35-1]|nr:hypothetical protein VP150E351_P0159 [Vibrio phage 150E35-1]